MSELLRADAPGALERAATILRHGGLVAFPTETVYGLGAHALDATAVRRIFEAKGRPAYNPIIVHVADVAAARALAREWPAAAERLAAAFWPGPLTLVVPKAPAVPDLVTAGLPAVALRVPAHPVAEALLRVAGIPIAAPSANRSGEVSPTSARHVEKSLGGRIDVVLDGGSTDIGIESTVVDLTGGAPRILRPGSIGPHELAAHLGPLQSWVNDQGPASPRPSPGLLDRHYAPRAELRLARSPADARRLLQLAGAARTGALVHTMPDPPASHVIRLPTTPADYARGLYAALHTLDELGCTVVVAETVPETSEWDGVRDRLRRAATT